AVFTYYGSAHTAAVKYSGEFKVVYFAFGYEGVGAFGTGNARLRSSLMDNIIAWFRYEPHKGDVNEDGNVDILDVVEAVNIILGLVEPTTAQFWAADVTQDGSIDILDVVNIVNVILGPTVPIR
ncbi:MAG: dockerin type I repeat-containing protein, partial [Gemmatimonadota bacterium]